MQMRVLQLVLWLLVCSITAVIETTVALPILCVTLLTAQFARKLDWTRAVLLLGVSFVLSSVLQASWLVVFSVLLLLPILSVLRAQTTTQSSMPLPLLLSTSVVIVVILAVATSVQPSLGTFLYTGVFLIIGYTVIYTLRLRKQRRRFVEWFWVSS